MNTIIKEILKQTRYFGSLPFLIFGMWVWTPGTLAEPAHPAALADFHRPPVKNSLVCMMNDKFMGTEQIPVPVGGKTYYGCCKGCAAALESNQNNIRYARDPYSGEEVDKADAFIAVKSPATKEVLYFKLEENYRKYSESINSQNLSKI